MRQGSFASNWRNFDFWLLGAVALLVIFGITMIRSAVAGNIELTTETNLVERQIEATDKQIDALVYELYGLTEEEIRIVEGAGK